MKRRKPIAKFRPGYKLVLRLSADLTHHSLRNGQCGRMFHKPFGGFRLSRRRDCPDSSLPIRLASLCGIGWDGNLERAATTHSAHRRNSHRCQRRPHASVSQFEPEIAPLYPKSDRTEALLFGGKQTERRPHQERVLNVKALLDLLQDSLMSSTEAGESSEVRKCARASALVSLKRRELRFSPTTLMAQTWPWRTPATMSEIFRNWLSGRFVKPIQIDVVDTLLGLAGHRSVLRPGPASSAPF